MAADAAALKTLVGMAGRPWTQHLRGAPETFAVPSAAGEYTDADLQLCSVVYLWLTDMLGHPLGARVRDALVGAGDAAPVPSTDKYGTAFREHITAYARVFRQYLAEGGSARIPLSLANAFSKKTLEMKRQWAWSVPSDAALDAMAAHAPLLEIGGGTGYWAGLLQARGVDMLCYDSSHEWNATWNTFESGDAAAVPTAYGNVRKGGPEQIPAHADRTLVLMWPDFMGRGSFGTDCLAAYTGETLVLIGEWRDATLGSYTDALPPTGQSFSAGFQEKIEAGFDLVRRVRLPNYPLYADSLMIYRRKSTEASAAAPQWAVLETPSAGRYLVARPKDGAGDIPARTELLRDAPLVKVTTKGTAGATASKYVDMFEAACGVSLSDSTTDTVGFEKKVTEGLEAFFKGGLQTTGDGWPAVQAEIVASAVGCCAELADGGALAHLLPQVVRVGGAFHYNGFGGVVDEETNALALRVFQSISLCNHSCAPNAAVKPNEGLLVSTAAIADGAPIAISYLEEAQMLLPTPQRRGILRERWGFECQCARCAGTAAGDDGRIFTLLSFSTPAPDTAPPAAMEFTDCDGDVISLRVGRDGAVIYALNGEDRPAARHLVLQPDGMLCLKDIDREIELPGESDPARAACMERLVAICGAGAVTAEGIVPLLTPGALEGVVREGRIVPAGGGETVLPEGAAAALLAAEASAAALVAAAEAGWSPDQVAEAMRFALRHPKHHLAFALLTALDKKVDCDAGVRAARVRSAMDIAATFEGGIAAVANLLADLHGAWAEALMRCGEDDHAAEVYNAQHHYRGLHDVVDEQWGDVGACQPNAQVMAFLFKD